MEVADKIEDENRQRDEYQAARLCSESLSRRGFGRRLFLVGGFGHKPYSMRESSRLSANVAPPSRRLSGGRPADRSGGETLRDSRQDAGATRSRGVQRGRQNAANATLTRSYVIHATRRRGAHSSFWNF